MATTAAENPSQTLAQPQHSVHNATPVTDDAPSAATLSPCEKPANSGREDSKNTATEAVAVNVSSSSDGCTESSIQKKIKRAERFGMSVQLSEEEKRNSRAERFGTGPALLGSDASNSSEEHKKKARAERFGLAQSSSADEEAKKKSRLERFGQVSKNEPLEEEKKKARAIRFSQSKPTSVSQMNGGETVKSETSIAGKSGGEA